MPKICEVGGCPSQARYGETIPTVCKKHNHMLWPNVKDKKCQHSGCNKTPSFGPGTMPIVCGKHNPANWDNIKSPNCAVVGCTKQPTYGLDKPVVCREHNEHDWPAVKAKICHQSGCTRLAIYGVEQHEAIVCSEHNPEKWPNVKDRLCEHPGCTKQPSFGLEHMSVCSSHNFENWPDRRKKRCAVEGCTTTPSFGPAGVTLVCSTHNVDHWPRLKNDLCQYVGCKTAASFGPTGSKPLVCSSHNFEGWANIHAKRCMHPDCNLSVNQNDEFCANHDTSRKRRSKVRETQVANYLLHDAKLPFDTWNKCLEYSRICADQTYFPDFTYDAGSHIVVLEVDELQHAHRGYSCDNKRMLDVFNTYGGLPVVFIRFNPDAYTLKNQLVPVADVGKVDQPRLVKLVDTISVQLQKIPEHHITIIRMYYDNTQHNNIIQRSWVDPDTGVFEENDLAVS